MPVEGFDDASKKIKQSAVARRKAARDQSSKTRQASVAKKAQKIKEQKEANAKNDADFRKYATKYQQNRLDANRTFRAGGSKRKFIDGVVARGKAAEAAKAKADGNITETVTPKPKAKVTPKPKVKVASKPKTKVTPKPETKVTPKPKATTPKVKSGSPRKDASMSTAKAKSPASTDSAFVKAFKKSVAAKGGVRSLGTYNKPTEIKKALEVTKKGSYNFNEGTGPNTSVFDKTKNVAPKTEEKKWQKKGTMSKGKAPRINAKPKKRAAKGSRAATLKKGFGY